MDFPLPSFPSPRLFPLSFALTFALCPLPVALVRQQDRMMLNGALDDPDELHAERVFERGGLFADAQAFGERAQRPLACAERAPFGGIAFPARPTRATTVERGPE